MQKSTTQVLKEIAEECKEIKHVNIEVDDLKYICQQLDIRDSNSDLVEWLISYIVHLKDDRDYNAQLLSCFGSGNGANKFEEKYHHLQKEYQELEQKYHHVSRLLSEANKRLDRLDGRKVGNIAPGEQLAYKNEVTRDKIERLLRMGYTQEKIAEKFGVSRATIWRRLNEG